MWNSIVSIPDLCLFIYVFHSTSYVLRYFDFITLTVAISNQTLRSIYMVLAREKQKIPVTSNYETKQLTINARLNDLKYSIREMFLMPRLTGSHI